MIKSISEQAFALLEEEKSLCFSAKKMSCSQENRKKCIEGAETFRRH